jgi:alpha-beta hydrolase superfamily lysophospholipase
MAMLMVHGFSSHSGPSRHVATYFAGLGIAVTQFDLRGHGLSQGARGHVLDFAEYVDDLASALSWARAREPNLPVVIMGHSMGALVALALVLEATEQSPDFLVLSAPWLKLRMKVSQPTHAGTVGDTRSLAFPNGLVADDLSRNQRVRASFHQDPLIHHVATMGWFMATLRAQARVQARAGSLTVPTLMLLAGDDRIVANGACRAFAKRAKAMVCMRTYQGLFHELYAEPEAESVLNDIATWLWDRLEKRTAQPT